MADFTTAYNKYIQPNEGYFANLEGENSITYGGINRMYNPSWEGWSIVDAYINAKGGVHNMKNNERIKAADPYVTKFFENLWNSKNLSGIKSQDVANITFDWIVNSDPATAIKHVQKIVGVSQDGNLGTNTLTAINKQNAAKLNNAIKDAREEYYKDINNPLYIKQWLTRLSKFPTLKVGVAISGVVVLFIIVFAFIVLTQK